MRQGMRRVANCQDSRSASTGSVRFRAVVRMARSIWIVVERSSQCSGLPVAESPSLPACSSRSVCTDSGCQTGSHSSGDVSIRRHCRMPHPPFCADTPARAAVGSRQAAAWPVGQDGQVLLARPPCCPQAAFLRSVVACHGHKSFPSSDRNFLELTRAYSGECFLYHFCLQLDFGPCGGKEDENCQPSSGNVLLISHVLIRSNQYFEPCLFCSFDQVAVVKVRPALFRGGTHQVLNEVSPQWHGRALIEQHLHDGFGVFNAFASC